MAPCMQHPDGVIYRQHVHHLWLLSGYPIIPMVSFRRSWCNAWRLPRYTSQYNLQYYKYYNNLLKDTPNNIYYLMHKNYSMLRVMTAQNEYKANRDNSMYCIGYRPGNNFSFHDETIHINAKISLRVLMESRCKQANRFSVCPRYHMNLNCHL